jgi:hypothetical protein
MKDPEDIVRRMHTIRRDVGDDVKGIVETAKTLSDWRYHVKHHPWLLMGAAAVVGFVVAPRKRKVPSDEAKELIDLLKKHNVAVAPPPNSGKSLARTLIGLAAPIAMRTIMAAAQQRFNEARFEEGDQRQPTEHEDYNIPR